MLWLMHRTQGADTTPHMFSALDWSPTGAF